MTNPPTNPPEHDPRQQAGYGAAPGEGHQPGYGQPPTHGEQPAYGQQPGYPPAGPGAYGSAPATRPKALDIAVKLMWAGAILTLLSAAAMLLLGNEMNAALDDALQQGTDGQLTPEQLDQVRGIGLGVGIATALLFALVSAGLWAWMAVKNKQGRSWARVTATVFGVIGILSGLFGLATALTEPVNGVLNLLSLAISIGALIFLWKKENNPYYAAMSAPRA